MTCPCPLSASPHLSLYILGIPSLVLVHPRHPLTHPPHPLLPAFAANRPCSAFCLPAWAEFCRCGRDPVLRRKHHLSDCQAISQFRLVCFHQTKFIKQLIDNHSAAPPRCNANSANRLSIRECNPMDGPDAPPSPLLLSQLAPRKCTRKNLPLVRIILTIDAKHKKCR